MNLVAESGVASRDGSEIGRLAGVVVNLDTNQLAALVVRAGEALGKVVVPVAAVADVWDDGVVLSEEAEAYVASARAVGSSGGTSRADEMPGQILDFGASIRALDGPIGSLRRVLYDKV